MKSEKIYRILSGAGKATACLVLGTVAVVYYRWRKQSVSVALEHDQRNSNAHQNLNTEKNRMNIFRLFSSLWSVDGTPLDKKFISDLKNLASIMSSLAKQVESLPDSSKKSSARSDWLVSHKYSRNLLKSSLETLAMCTKNSSFVDILLRDGRLLNLIRGLISEHKDVLNFDNNVQLAEIFSNLSAFPTAHSFLESSDIQKALSTYRFSNSIHLNLYASKVDFNLSSAKIGGSVFLHDIYPLNPFKTRASTSSDSDFDVIFINGMRGSVFFTWRQRDEVLLSDPAYTKCWPKDWLITDLPDCRVLSVNANIKPFIWNEICPIDRKKCGLEAWATDVLRQLNLAGVGKRPIIWVTHSAGGILVKEMLRQSHNECSPNDLLHQTKGIVFMSVPHRGSQSLLGLHYYPFKYFLTPEAKEFEQDSKQLIALHEWFMTEASSRSIATMNMNETQLTQVMPYYKVVLVPEDIRDSGFSEVIRVEADHQNISKPVSKSDIIYISILSFLKSIISQENAPTSETSTM